MQGADTGQRSTLDGKPWRIGLVQARFNEKITQALAQQCTQALRALGVEPAHIEHVTVPGALEVPLALQALARTHRFDALIALGCIIRGETYHFDLVANESGAGVTRVALDHHLPIVNAILTVENGTQAWARVEPIGTNSAHVAIEMAQLVKAAL